jgi:hypothetical protein
VTACPRRSISPAARAASSIGQYQTEPAGYLDAEVQAYLGAIAARKGVPLSELTNDLLKKEIAILQAAATD